MAKAAKVGDAVPAQNKKPDYAKAINLIRTRGQKLTSDAKAINGDVSQLYKTIEDDLNVNRWAAKTYAMLERRDEVSRNERIRALIEMLTTGGLMPGEDLVDKMESGEEPDRGDGDEFDAAAPKGEVVQMRRGKASMDDEFGQKVDEMLGTPTVQ